MSDTIYNRLLAGESIDDIMAQITEEANAAQKRLEEERKAREAEQAKATDRKAELITLLNSILSWIARYYPAFGFKEDDWDDEDLEVMAGLVLAILNAEAGKKKVTKALSTDEVFDKFFGTFGLKS